MIRKKWSLIGTTIAKKKNNPGIDVSLHISSNGNCFPLSKIVTNSGSFVCWHHKS